MRRHRTVFRTASAPIYEDSTEDSPGTRAFPSLPPIHSVGISTETPQGSQDVERGPTSSNPSPTLSEGTRANHRSTTNNQVYVEVHDHFVIECPCEECHNVITVDRQTKINSKQPSNQVDSSSSASSGEGGTPSANKLCHHHNGRPPASLQHENENPPEALPIKTTSNSSPPLHNHHNRLSNSPKLRPVVETDAIDNLDSNDSGNGPSISSLTPVPPTKQNNDENTSSVLNDTNGHPHLSTKTESKDKPELNNEQINALKAKRALFAQNSRKNILNSIKPPLEREDEIEKDDKISEEELNKTDMDSDGSVTNPATNSHHPASELLHNTADLSQRTIQKKPTLSETPLCNISQFYKEQVGFVIT